MNSKYDKPFRVWSNFARPMFPYGQSLLNYKFAELIIWLIGVVWFHLPKHQDPFGEPTGCKAVQENHLIIAQMDWMNSKCDKPFRVWSNFARPMFPCGPSLLNYKFAELIIWLIWVVWLHLPKQQDPFGEPTGRKAVQENHLIIAPMDWMNSKCDKPFRVWSNFAKPMFPYGPGLSNYKFAKLMIRLIGVVYFHLARQQDPFGKPTGRKAIQEKIWS
jgi:hypothetical protein